MKLIVRVLLIGAITYFLSPYFMWWIGMVVAFSICYLSPSGGLNAFVAGFLGMGLTWLSHAWNLDVLNQSVFSGVIAQLMQVNDPILLVLASGLVGGLAGGFSGVSGTSFRQLFRKEKSGNLYN